MQLARRLGFATAAGLFMGLIGPFGSYDVTPLERVAAWLLCFWTGALVFGPALAAAGRWSARSSTPAAFARVVATALAAIPVALVAAAAFHGVAHVPMRRIHWLEWYAQVLAISLPLTLGYMFASDRLLGGPASTPTPDAPIRTPPERATLAERLPARLGRDLIALEMEDHYVRAHTPLGSDLLLTPLTQAIEELGGLDGLRVHRSWWVARAAVVGAAWEGRNLRLKLKGGLEAPVARAQVAQVRAAGWLDVPLRGEADRSGEDSGEPLGPSRVGAPR